MKNKIKEVREKAGLTQEQLSKKADISRTILSGLESGRIEITTTATIQKIADALETSISKIFFEC